MAFSAQELSNIANALLDYNIKGPAASQIKQDRPLFDALDKKAKTFPGGKGAISEPVKGVYTTALQGYTHNDTVSYSNPANIKRTSVNWYELHAGISFTLTELKKDGITVVDTESFDKTVEHTDRELVVLTGLLNDKIEDMQEGYYRSFTSMMWADGTQDAKAIPGILSIILDDPTVAGNTLGIDRVANAWWRNRASLAIASSSATYDNQPLVQTLQKEFRQLRRFGGRPDLFLAGSDFMDAFEHELRAKGNFTMEGWAKGGKIDASVADLMFKGIAIQYDPALDDIGRSKYGYVIDTNHLYLNYMDGEKMKTHNPARPATEYVVYRAVTTTGALCANQLNCHGVYSIA